MWTGNLQNLISLLLRPNTLVLARAMAIAITFTVAIGSVVTMQAVAINRFLTLNGDYHQWFLRRSQCRRSQISNPELLSPA